MSTITGGNHVGRRDRGRIERQRYHDAGLAHAGDELKLERLADVPIYFADAIARRSEPLLRTADAQAPLATISADLAKVLGVQAGDMVTVQQGEGSATLVAAIDARLPANVVRVAAAHQLTSSLGAMFGPISIEKA